MKGMHSWFVIISFVFVALSFGCGPTHVGPIQGSSGVAAGKIQQGIVTEVKKADGGIYWLRVLIDGKEEPLPAISGEPLEFGDHVTVCMDATWLEDQQHRQIEYRVAVKQRDKE